MPISDILRRWRKSLQTKSTLAIIITAGVLMELSSAVQYWFAREGIKQEVQHRAKSELKVKNLEIEKVITAVETASNSTVWMLEQQLGRPDSLASVMRQMILHNDHIMGCGMGFMPDYYPQKGRWFEPYVDRLPDGSCVDMQIGSEAHDYLKSDWYAIPMQSGKGYWTEPYFDDAGGKTVMITYAQPVRDKQGRVVAIFGTDVSLEWLSKVLNEHHIYPSSYNLMVSRTGKLMACPVESLVMEKSIQEVTAHYADTSVKRVNSQMMEGLSGQATIIDEDGEKNYVFFAPVGRDSILSNGEQLGWSMAVVCSDREIYQGLRQISNVLLFLMLLGLVLLAFILKRVIKGFQRLQAVNAEKERVDNELTLARNIQMAMLPKAYTPHPDHGDVVVHAALTPARQVGGDFYDYFQSGDKLLFCIGDVAGKGVPAALVMAVARSMFQMLSANETMPDSIVSQMNEAMARDNDYNIFITFFVGMLDLPTGRLRYCNAGHKAPWILHAPQKADADENRENSWTVTPLAMDPNLPIGAMTGWDFSVQEYDVSTGDMIFLYTDGLNEAENANHDQFEREGIPQILQTMAERDDPKGLIDGMTDAVFRFVGDTDQSDDLTMLAIQYLHQPQDNGSCAEITLPNDINETPQLAEFLEVFCEEAGLGPSASMQVNLAMEEAVVNVMNYAYPEGEKGDVHIKAEIDGENLKFTITDSGQPFDPTAQEEIDISLPAEQRPIGGLGIHLMRHYMDQVHYKRLDGLNVLTLLKQIKTTTDKDQEK